MRRTVLLAVVLLTGCGTVAEPEAEPLPPGGAAEPQQVDLDWLESYPTSGEQLRFAVDELTVRPESWSVDVAITNATQNSFALGSLGPQLSFGLMLFGTGELEELEDANREGDLPAVRVADTIEPRPPNVLTPGTTWRATLTGRGSLADDSYLRVTFGPLQAIDERPEGMQKNVFWITDRAHRL